MRFPSVPNERFLSQERNQLENGTGINTPWRVFHTLTTQTLQKHFNFEGVLFPFLEEEKEQKLNNEGSIGKIFYSKKDSSLKMNNTGTHEKIGPATLFLTTSEIAGLTLANFNGQFIQNTDTNVLNYILNATLKEVTLT